MLKLDKVTGIVAPLDRANVDTDAIMPKQFLKSIKKTGFGDFIFDEWRYLDHGEPGMDVSKRKLNPNFSLNKVEYFGASILLTRDNFGCGSSREHAPWGLKEYGFVVLIAPSFAEIFYNNCLKNGMLPISFDKQIIDGMFQMVYATPGIKFSVDLNKQTVFVPGGDSYIFNIDNAYKKRLLEGLDDIDITLEYSDQILAYEQQRLKLEPWIFSNINLNI